MGNMLGSLTRFGFSCDVSASQLRSAREDFEQHDFLRLQGFIEPELLRVLQRSVRIASFKGRAYDVGRDLTLSDSPVTNVVNVMMNDPKLFRVVRRVTGCGPIGCFMGRLYRMVEQQGQAFKWHDDMLNDRKVAISINVSDEIYRGGTLQIRDTSSGERASAPNLGFGDAIIFRVAGHLEHRVTPVVGKFPKTAVTGWFCSRPKYTSVHREMVARSESAIAARTVRKNGIASISPCDALKIPSAVVSQTTAGESFVANIETAMCYGLNQSGSRIWELMAQGLGIRSISETIAHEYSAPRQDVERDVLALSHQLAQRDLIKVVRRTVN
jgi:hypothetical protein